MADSPTPDAVADVAAILPAWLSTVQTARGLTGVQAAIWHQGTMAADVAVGPADEPADIPLTTTHRLRIASHSKMFCALTIMRLVERGDLRLDDTLGERVAKLADSPVAPLTLRDLLSHAAGLTRDGADAGWWELNQRFPDRAQLLDLARTAVVTEPGLHLQYSNIGFGLLGCVIEEATGIPFDQAVRELVLDPVDAGPVGPDLPEHATGPEDPEGFAVGHTGSVHGPRRVVEQVPTGALAPATGFWATASGIAAVAGRLFCEDALLDPSTLRTMRRRVWSTGQNSGYGLGLQQDQVHGFTVIGHSGGFPTGLTRTWAAPSAQLAVSVLGTAVDAPSSSLATGVLGLLALAGGTPAPGAAENEASGALGGASNGRPRPAELSEQPDLEIDGRTLSAREIAETLAGGYDSQWGRTRLAILGGRLFALDEAMLDPADGALELQVSGTRPDPADPSITTIELATWGDSGYGSWAEPMLAQWVAGPHDPRCAGVWETGHLARPSAEFAVLDRVRAPR